VTVLSQMDIGTDSIGNLSGIDCESEDDSESEEDPVVVIISEELDSTIESTVVDYFEDYLENGDTVEAPQLPLPLRF